MRSARSIRAPLLLAGATRPTGTGSRSGHWRSCFVAAADAPRRAGAEEVRTALAARSKRAGAARARRPRHPGGDPRRRRRRQRHRGAFAARGASLIAALADERPVLIAVDDLHWADEGFLDLRRGRRRLCPRNRADRLHRATEIDERRPGLAAEEGRERIDLGPLAPAAVRGVGRRARRRADADLAQQIALAGGGNPFFTEEIARAIEADGADVAQPPAGHGPGRDRLPPRRASGAGEARRPVRRRPRRPVSGRGARESCSAAEPADALARLERRTLIEDRTAEEAGVFGFHHQLIRDVAYASLTRAERVDLHVRAAAGVASRAGERYAELAEVIAFHFARAAELDPDEERRVDAFETIIRASATRRGAGPRLAPRSC